MRISIISEHSMKKSISTRIRVTKNGKILRRAMSQGHFLAKKRTVQIKRKKLLRGLDNFGKKIVKKYKGTWQE